MRAAAVLSVVLVISGFGGAWLARSRPARISSNPAPASRRTTTAHVIDMRRSIPRLCSGPVAPGTGHPQAVLSQMFRVTDDAASSYLLGWQLVPYHGAGVYRLGTGGNLLALEPSESGAPLGFATGTLRVDADGTAGVVNASVRLAKGGAMRVSGTWSCGG